MFIDFYELLGISSSASSETIKAAYRKQSIKWHPDKNPNLDTTNKMQEINQAYLILKDSEARKRYDEEYYRFKSFIQEQSKEFYDDASRQEQSGSYTTYEFKDEILEKWMSNARKQAEIMVRDINDELKGASKEAGSSILSFFLKTMLPMLIGYLLFKACANL